MTKFIIGSEIIINKTTGKIIDVNIGGGKYGDDLITVKYDDGAIVIHSPNLESYYADREFVLPEEKYGETD